MSRIAIVVPTIRFEKEFNSFLKSWESLFIKHKVDLVVVRDGNIPVLYHYTYVDGIQDLCSTYHIEDVMGSEYSELIINKTASVRNLGFAFVARFLPSDIIITLDDDEEPVGDTIQDHLNVLSRKVPVSWISTLVDDYPRGFPYGLWEESEVVISHGVWEGVADWSAITQITRGNPSCEFYHGPIPKGIYAPISSMNLAFQRQALPWIYHAPMSMETWGFDRFDDIFMGVRAKRELDARGLALVTGYATVLHQRASNAYTNLEKESKGIRLNEGYWQGIEDHPYFEFYNKQYFRWQEFVEKYQ